jgi:uncharacterized membrane protein YjjB (DUF3815 family)
MTAQLLSVHVPHTNTNLQLGSSVGGPGVSLATAGDVLVDSVGVMDIQSKGAFVGQTSAAMSMLSASVQKIHSQGKVELFAGGGKSPAACGPGGPVTAADAGPPGAITEKVTGVACAVLTATSAGYGLQDAFTPQLAIAAPGLVAQVPAVAVAGVALGVSAMAGAAVAGAVGGGTDIEERASSNITMVAGKKISGIAPGIIGYKTLGKWEVKALLVTDFTTTLFTNFALAKFEVRALDAFETTSSAFEVEADVAVEIETKEFTGRATLITMDGATKVTKIMDVMGKTTCQDALTVSKKTTMTGKLFVKRKTDIKGKLTVQCTEVKGSVTVGGDFKTDKVEFKASTVFGM